MECHVRPARPDEAAAVAELASATFPLACPADMGEDDIRDYSEGHLTESHFAAHLADPDADVLVCDGDGLVGYALVFHGEGARPSPEFGVTAAPASFLSKCYVRPDAHGSGVAKRLLDAAAATAAARGSTGLWLNVNYENFRAMRFYEKHGWRHTGYTEFKVGQRVHRDPVYEFRLHGADLRGEDSGT
ncbi:GNAT family N-acetyltransferase [Tessaracoccus oleiagri]|uniref:Ribosomal protein S18 acetylase RimI n=1 Tax=Tessaracoccus oleiagri TaxID=686624 RepID=A0A1G9JTU7_9ACTN|nr:GNAT family N-acetyltransferase [Tessaracoccus oleiagri]SDL40313.1 Ribosomal protein S18 acetylase RimI [Tessaracoccus oleiagri]